MKLTFLTAAASVCLTSAVNADTVYITPLSYFLGAIGGIVDGSQNPATLIPMAKALGIKKISVDYHVGVSFIKQLSAGLSGVNTILQVGKSPVAADIQGVVSEAKALIASGVPVTSIEGPYEPDNFPVTYKGSTCGKTSASWAACAAFQLDLYNAVHAALTGVDAMSLSHQMSETSNEGLQFLKIPNNAAGHATDHPIGTTYGDDWNMHCPPDSVGGNPPITPPVGESPHSGAGRRLEERISTLRQLLAFVVISSLPIRATTELRTAARLGV